MKISTNQPSSDKFKSFRTPLRQPNLTLLKQIVNSLSLSKHAIQSLRHFRHLPKTGSFKQSSENSEIRSLLTQYFIRRKKGIVTNPYGFYRLVIHICAHAAH